MPTNLYGPGDNYHPENSHVIPGLIRRFHKAKMNNDKEVVVWGTGTVLREFLHVDDMAKASIHVMNIDAQQFNSAIPKNGPYINVGYGKDILIGDLAALVKKTVGFKGSINFDLTKPDGTHRKLLDITLISKLGWKPSIDLSTGLKSALEDYLR